MRYAAASFPMCTGAIGCQDSKRSSSFMRRRQRCLGSGSSVEGTLIGQYGDSQLSSPDPIQADK